MAERPWVTPEEVRAYSEKPSVQSRTDERLAVDIGRAEQYVITYTHNDFCCCDQIPEPVRLAVIILAEAYAWNSYVSMNDKKSESFDDYSYTDGSEAVSLDDLDLAALLDDFVITKASGNVFMRMRKL